jgi:glycosyltransferase involved in cell wall biosynthesis
MIDNVCSPDETALPEVSVVLPCFNEAESLSEILSQIRRVLKEIRHEIIVVDDASKDETVSIASKQGVRVVSHPYNKGNGAAVKTGIREARGKVIVLMDADGQHDPARIPNLLEKMERYDLVVGARNAETEQAWHRKMANGFYNGFATYITGVRITDLTSGFRAVRAEVARKFLYLLPNTFSYPTTMTIASIKAGYSVAFVPVTVNKRSGGRSKINLLQDGSRFFIILFKIATLFSPLKVFLPLSIGFFVAGSAYASYTLIAFTDFRPFALLLLMFSVMLFSLGLISEQITQLRSDRTDDHHG